MNKTNQAELKADAPAEARTEYQFTRKDAELPQTSQERKIQHEAKKASAPETRDLKKALARIRKAQRYNSELAKTLREDGRKTAAEYAEGSAFGFWQSEQILTGKAK